MFEAQIAKINKLADKVISVIGETHSDSGEIRAKGIELICGEASGKLRTEIERAADLVNHGFARPPETSQVMADRLMQAHDSLQ